MSARGRINILEDITIKSSNAENPISATDLCSSAPILEHSYKANIFDTDCTVVSDKRKSRHTASMDLFEEEPVFSDSEDEREFTRKVLESQNISLVSNEKPKKRSIEVQCDLPMCNMQIREFVEKCAKLNPEVVNGEFKELIQLCRYLNEKSHSAMPALSENKANTFSQVTAFELKPQETAKSSSKISEEFLPSRQGNNDFLSESINCPLGCSSVEYLCSSQKSVKAVNGNREESSVKVMKSNLTPRLRSSTVKNKDVTLNSEDVLEKAAKEEQPFRKRRKTLPSDSNEARLSYKRNAKGSANTTTLALRRSPRLKQLIDLKNNPVKVENMSLKQNIRRLYSPTQWVLSKEFASICEKF